MCVAWADKEVGLGQQKEKASGPGPVKREGQWAWAQGARLGQQKEKANGPGPRGRAWASKKRKPVGLSQGAGLGQQKEKASGPGPWTSEPGRRQEAQWA